MTLKHPPIVEAVIDFDCEMPADLDLEQLETAARAAFGGDYPELRRAYFAEGQTEFQPDEHQMSFRRGLLALQLLQKDGKQLVQVRTTGFSFNRLAPYRSLRDYLPEIKRTWRLFVDLASPIQVRTTRLRYINRMLLPMVDNRVELDNYLRAGPRLPDEKRLTLNSFLNQHVAAETGTENEVKFVLASQPSEGGSIPIIFDIEASRPEQTDPDDWESLFLHIESLSDLKNLVFRKTLTKDCMRLFE